MMNLKRNILHLVAASAAIFTACQSWAQANLQWQWPSNSIFQQGAVNVSVAAGTAYYPSMVAEGGPNVITLIIRGNPGGFYASATPPNPGGVLVGDTATVTYENLDIAFLATATEQNQTTITTSVNLHVYVPDTTALNPPGIPSVQFQGMTGSQLGYKVTFTPSVNSDNRPINTYLMLVDGGPPEVLYYGQGVDLERRHSPGSCHRIPQIPSC